MVALAILGMALVAIFQLFSGKPAYNQKGRGLYKGDLLRKVNDG